MAKKPIEDASPKIYQHGDVCLVEEQVPVLEDRNRIEALERTPDGRLILALGEATGHAHILSAEGVTLVNSTGGLVLEITQPVELSHEKNGRLTGEHRTLTIPPGRYIPLRQHVYDWLEGWRAIED
ncbi:MAG: hypothetical protein IIC64_11995 [SAR324 cluster bacterium]|nr:hypothetical protein [SAR324 cluster bacterium]